MLMFRVVMILAAQVLVHMVNEHHRSVQIAEYILDLDFLSFHSVHDTNAIQRNR